MKKQTPLYVVYKKPTLNIKPQVKNKFKKAEGWRNIHYANTNQKKAGVTILISDREDFSTGKVIRGKERHLRMIKGSVHQEHMTILTCVCT